MRKSLIIFILSLLLYVVAIKAHTYADHSVLSQADFVKVQVSETGLHKLTYEQLQQMELNPERVRIFGYGGGMLSQNFMQAKIDDLPEVPYYKHTAEQGSFKKGDYILFYAQGSFTWSFLGSRFRHTRNPYSDYGYYFLTDGLGSASDFQAKKKTDAHPKENLTLVSPQYKVHENDLCNLIDPISGISGGGREFYGERINNKGSLSLSFDFSDIDTSRPIVATADVAVSDKSETEYVLSANGTSKTIPMSGTSENYEVATIATDFFSFTPSASGTQNIRLTLNGTSNSVGYLNYVEATADCFMRLRDVPLYVRNRVADYGQEKTLTYCVTGATQTAQVWEVTDLANIRSVDFWQNKDSLFFEVEDSRIHEFVVFNKDASVSVSPKNIGKIDRQNLHSVQNADLVIITPKVYKEAADTLANLHKRVDGFKTLVVTDEQVFNEFSSGTPDATAYRWLMKMLYDRNKDSETAPKNLILFGDGSFDNRRLLPMTKENLLLTYQSVNSTHKVHSYVSDDYYTYLEDNESIIDSSSSMDIAIGRMPVNSLDEALALVRKIERYLTEPHPGNWLQQLLVLADDGDENLHASGADLSAEYLRLNVPDLIVNKIYLDAYQQVTNATGESYPQAKTRFDNLLFNGVQLFLYSGHASATSLSNESMLTAKELQKMNNKNQGFWLLATCSFGEYDANVQSAAEEAVLNEFGGAIALLASARTVYASQNTALAKLVCQYLFEHSDDFTYPCSIGDAIRKAKNSRKGDENKLPYTLLGDPALHLPLPVQNRVNATLANDTLKALSTRQIEGFIETPEGDTATWFNGTVSMTLYDKVQQVTTMDNDQTNQGKKVFYTFNDYPNILYKGESEVKNGKFSFTVMMPKDIKYNYGNGRMVFYAYDHETYSNAVGHNHDVIIGGSEPTAEVDTVGPQVTVYLNNPAFRDGERTHANPVFYAEVSDPHGINTTGNGIGHDMQLVVDGDSKRTYLLNDLFEYETNSFQAGVVSYNLYNLPDGKHTLRFRCWDLLNNSTTVYLNFIVGDTDVALYNTSVYPNPVEQNGMITVILSHDRPNSLLQIDYSLYATDGRLVTSLTQQGNGTIQVDLAPLSLPKGLYIYKIRIKTADTGYTNTTGKLLIQ